MPIDLNQFAMAPAAGQIDLQFHGSVIQARVNSAQATPILAGQAVRLVDNGSELPEVLSVDAGTDQALGVAGLNVKNGTYIAGKIIDVAMKNSVIYVTSGGAIARGAKVYYNPATKKFQASATSSAIVGWAFDKATAVDQPIRVYLETPVQA